MSPYEIDVLLHYYSRTDNHPDIVRKPPIWAPTIERFLRENVLEAECVTDHPVIYRITERGRVYCQALQPRAVTRTAMAHAMATQ